MKRIVRPRLDSRDLHLMLTLASGPLTRPWRIAYRRETEPLAALVGAALADCAPRIYL